MFGSASACISMNSLNCFRNVIVNNTHHDRFMYLKIFVDSEDPELKALYLNAASTHNEKIMNDPHFFDAGFDMFLPENKHFYNSDRIDSKVNKVDFKIKCCAKIHVLGACDETKEYFSGFYTHPRSSLSKTPLRLANSTGIIDAGYRGNLIGMFDCIWSNGSCSSSDSDYSSARLTRLLQICSPGLVPIYVEIVDSIESLGPNTSRGIGGIGSTGI
jgi:hypothetical protein